MRVLINIFDMSRRLSDLYFTGEIDKSLFKQLSKYLVEGQYKNVAIYLYKREYMKMDNNDVHNCLTAFYAQGILRKPLFISFSKEGDHALRMATMWLIKNDHTKYVDDNMNIKNDPFSQRRVLRE